MHHYATRGPNGPDIVTRVFCHNLVKIHLVVIEILSFSCSVLLLVKADGDHLAVPNSKKNQNGLMQRLLYHKAGTIPLKDFSSFIL